jgi:formiminotetrahydrofolate cyclodeaminase
MIQCCLRIAEIGNTTVLSDVATGAILASSAGDGAAFMVRINLRSMKDDKLVAEFGDRMNTALTIIAAGVQQVINRVGGRS